jgi:hypothetical protein
MKEGALVWSFELARRMPSAGFLPAKPNSVSDRKTRRFQVVTISASWPRQEASATHIVAHHSIAVPQ